MSELYVKGDIKPRDNIIFDDGKVRISQNAGITSQLENAIAIGFEAGMTSQGLACVAIGRQAGDFGQSAQCVAIGNEAGTGNQSDNSVAIGNQAGRDSQQFDCIAIGHMAGVISQRDNSIALGYHSGQVNLGINSISIGHDAARGDVGELIDPDIQADRCISIGYQTGVNGQFGVGAMAIGAYCGSTNQGTYAISLGHEAGQTAQGAHGIAIGHMAGNLNQNIESIAIGRGCGGDTQNAYAIAMGSYAGETNQAQRAIAFGYTSGMINQGERGIAIGDECGLYRLGVSSIAIGYNAGYGDSSPAVTTPQGQNNIAIGTQAGFEGQLNTGCIAIGHDAGRTGQNNNTVAIGTNAGHTNQGGQCVAIGNNAANTNQGIYAIAVGEESGFFEQGSDAIAIGRSAGTNTQNNNSIAIGAVAGTGYLGANSIAIGYLASSDTITPPTSTLPANNIVINATGVNYLPTTDVAHTNRCFVRPIREAENDKTLKYDVATGEITYGEPGGGSSTEVNTEAISVPPQYDITLINGTMRFDVHVVTTTNTYVHAFRIADIPASTHIKVDMNCLLRSGDLYGNIHSIRGFRRDSVGEIHHREETYNLTDIDTGLESSMIGFVYDTPTSTFIDFEVIGPAVTTIHWVISVKISSNIQE